jgi:hypothetical protein
MKSATPQEIQNDELAVAVARAIVVSNAAARANGIDPVASLVTIEQQSDSVWRLHYGPRDYIGRRGGDITVLVNDQTRAVEQILRGQ